MTAAADKKSETNVKETIESILVAFILAFIFRCFVVEAFVIPTGSMAPTLMGAHMTFRCPDCGYNFEAGYATGGDSFAILNNAEAIYPIYCPNCGLHLPKSSVNDPDNDATTPPLKFGDRILVMKYLNLFGDNPQRWDVVVFKSPENIGAPGDYSVNYIKRLIGKPGESLFIGQGDVYVAPPGSDKQDPKSYKVQTKPKWVQDALWRIIFDADFVPQSRGGDREATARWTQPWQQAAGTGWSNDNPSTNTSPRQFRFDNPAGAGVLVFNRNANPTAATFNDWLAYDQTGNQTKGDRYNDPPYSDVRSVGDLKVQFYLSKLKGDGAIRAVLSKQTADLKGSYDFIAELQPNQSRLIMRSPDGVETVIGTRSMKLTGIHHIEFEDVDYKATLRIDGKEVLATGAEYQPDVQAVINFANVSPASAARIEGERSSALIEHLQLWRDNFYRSDRIERAFPTPSLNDVVTLKEKEYFCAGDNSFMSADGRLWTQSVNLPNEALEAQAGVVPERFMLGKAFFVYWPAGFKPFGLPIRAVPNFGDMRFIR